MDRDQVRTSRTTEQERGDIVTDLSENYYQNLYRGRTVAVRLKRDGSLYVLLSDFPCFEGNIERMIGSYK